MPRFAAPATTVSGKAWDAFESKAQEQIRWRGRGGTKQNVRALFYDNGSKKGLAREHIHSLRSGTTGNARNITETARLIYDCLAVDDIEPTAIPKLPQDVFNTLRNWWVSADGIAARHALIKAILTDFPRFDDETGSDSKAVVHAQVGHNPPTSNEAGPALWRQITDADFAPPLEPERGEQAIRFLKGADDVGWWPAAHVAVQHPDRIESLFKRSQTF
ncbi:MAG TPA: hypothetical protein PLM58_03935, partial [Novosphingobium sp.]|nr:hypothetical protein [Novosphingobium sp.]